MRDGETPDLSLPDDAYQAERRGGGIGFAPGATNGILGHAPIDRSEGLRNARILHETILRLLRKPEAEFEEGVTRLFVTSYATTTLPHLLELLAQKPARKWQKLLYTRMRRLLLESGHREIVKFALGITASFRRTEDLEVFRMLARHPEFASYVWSSKTYCRLR